MDQQLPACLDALALSGDVVIFSNAQFITTFLSPAAVDLASKRKGVFGKDIFTALDIAKDDDPWNSALEAIDRVGSWRATVPMRTTENDVRWLEWFVARCEGVDGVPHGCLWIGRDVTDVRAIHRKAATYVLMLRKLEEEHSAVLETAAEQDRRLEESYTTLRVLTERNARTKQDVEDTIGENIRQLVAPILQTLKKNVTEPRSAECVRLLESGLGRLAEPFLSRVSFAARNLTATEIQVANMVREGKTSKEIGDILAISETTVKFHRGNIRRKLGLARQNQGLRGYLLALPKE